MVSDGFAQEMSFIPICGGQPSRSAAVRQMSVETPRGRGSAIQKDKYFSTQSTSPRKRKKRRQPDRREKKAPAKAIAKKQPTKPAPSRTPEEIAAAKETSQVARREYEQARNRNPERMEYNRRLAQEQRRIAKATGKCRSCPKPAIPEQTRCPRCAEHHRQSRRLSDAKRRAAAKETATADQADQ